MHFDIQKQACLIDFPENCCVYLASKTLMMIFRRHKAIENFFAGVKNKLYSIKGLLNAKQPAFQHGFNLLFAAMKAFCKAGSNF
jgi:hypothetical protein